MQFFAACSNTEVTMTNVSISDPVSFIRTFELNGEHYVKNLKIRMQEYDLDYDIKPESGNLNLRERLLKITEYMRRNC